MTADAALIVLAGGRSARMGRPKAELQVGSGTLLEWVVRRHAHAFRETLVCGGSAPAGARAVADLVPGAGPLAGIAAGLVAMRADRGFVLACDMPRVGPAVATLLLERARGHDAAVPVVGGVPQPTCAVYARSAAAPLAAALRRGRRRVGDAIAELDTVLVGEDDLIRADVALDEFLDVDTPAAYEAFLAGLSD